MDNNYFVVRNLLQLVLKSGALGEITIPWPNYACNYDYIPDFNLSRVYYCLCCLKHWTFMDVVRNLLYLKGGALTDAPPNWLRVAKARSCDLTSRDFFPVNPPPPLLSYGAEKRRDHRNCVGVRQISVIQPLLSTITQAQGGGGGGFTGKKIRLG